jgi:hypothetical protein
MKALGKFILLDLNEFDDWLNLQNINRKINLIQQHHTYLPSYKHFKDDNHFELCKNMEKDHLERGFAEIAQTFTTFPDGKIMICRNLNTIPAGIKGANLNGICIENVGNFERGKDIMTPDQSNTIIAVTRLCLSRLKLEPSDRSVVYHHWFDLTLGKRILTEGTGNTKTCPGENFFGGNTIDSFNLNFLPLLR